MTDDLFDDAAPDVLLAAEEEGDRVRRAAAVRGARRCPRRTCPAELGALRMGNGPKARIGFDLANIELWKRDNQIRPPEARRTPRRRPRLNTISRGPRTSSRTSHSPHRA